MKEDTHSIVLRVLSLSLKPSHSYGDLGTSASFVSRHNFVVIDVSAGPVSFGPQASPAGEIEPVTMPRILVR